MDSNEMFDRLLERVEQSAAEVSKARITASGVRSELAEIKNRTTVVPDYMTPAKIVALNAKYDGVVTPELIDDIQKLSAGGTL